MNWTKVCVWSIRTEDAYQARAIVLDAGKILPYSTNGDHESEGGQEINKKDVINLS
jgi:hypothetical protein